MTKQELENNLIFKNWFAENEYKIIELCKKQKERWRYALIEDNITNYKIFTKIFNQFLFDDLWSLKLYEGKKAIEKVRINYNLRLLIFEKVEKCF